jgi:hypothetical protein
MIEARRIFWVGSFAAFFVLLPSRACGQASTPPKICVDWGNVQNWTGTISISGGGSASDPNSGVQYITSESGVVSLTGITNRTGPCNASTAQYVWQAAPTQVTLSNVSIHDKFISPQADSNGNPCTLTTSYDVDGGTGSTTLSSGASIFLDLTVPSSPVYTASVSTYQDVAVTLTGCGASGTASPQSGYQWGPGNPPPSAYPGLPSTVGPVNPSVGFTAQGPLGGLTNSWTMSWNLKPIVPQVDVLVTTTSDYCMWRPTAGASETDINTEPLGILALLVQHGTNQVQNGVIPSDWTFKLTRVSQEPGVALNWPVSGISSNDMAFNSTINVVGNPTVTISPDGTQAEFITPITLPNPALASAAVSTFDWGGWATLNVTATVSGQPQATVKGYIQQCDGSTATDILLPARQPGSVIADSWKKAHGVSLSIPDSDDSEISKDGNTNNGDGLTLYEEYRGFYVDCPPPPLSVAAGCVDYLPTRSLLHVEGDPIRKDLFVVNDSWPEVQQGMTLFAAGTGVNVCCATLRDDQITEDHIINIYHNQGPTLGPQHAIVVVKGAPGTAPCTQGGPAQPKYIKQIFFPSMTDVLTKVRNDGVSAAAAWTAQSYPGMLAHELGHAVNVFHHGDADRESPHDETGMVQWSTPDGVAILESVGSGTPVPVNVFLEDGTPVFARVLNISVGSPRKLWQGLNTGQHSGDVMCFMRYNISQQYISNAEPSVRYYVPEREAKGTLLTAVTTGTGTNSVTEHPVPQPRYGDALRGNCSLQLCVSDAIPLPAPSPTQQMATCPGN